MDIDKITSIKSLVINTKIVNKSIYPFFHAISWKSPGIFPKYKGYFSISESFTFN